MFLGQCFSTRGDFASPPGNNQQHLETFLIVTTWKWAVMPASSGQRPGMLLEVSQSMGQCPTKGGYLVQTVNSAEVEESCPRHGTQKYLLTSESLIKTNKKQQSTHSFVHRPLKCSKTSHPEYRSLNSSEKTCLQETPNKSKTLFSGAKTTKKMKNLASRNRNQMLRDIKYGTGNLRELWVQNAQIFHTLNTHQIGEQLKNNSIIHFLLLKLYYLYVSASHQGKLGKGYTRTLHYLCNFSLSLK